MKRVLGILLGALLLVGVACEENRPQATTVPSGTKPISTTVITATPAEIIVPPTLSPAEDVRAKLLESFEDKNVYGDILIKTTSQFQLAYIAKDDYFAISLLSVPLSEARKAAEQYLLQRSGNNLEGLCSLTFKVDIGAPLYVIQETGETVEHPHVLDICPVGK